MPDAGHRAPDNGQRVSSCFPYMFLTPRSVGYRARPRILGDLAESQTQD